MRFLLFGIACFLLAVFAGVGSALYAIRYGVPYVTEKVGPWISWPGEGHPGADLYTRAYLAESGRLPITSTTVRYFAARSDSEGHALTSACEYLVSGAPLDARWWSLALYDGRDRLIPNPSGRHSFNSSDTLRRTDGTYRVSISRQARPENWLPAGDGAPHDLLLLLRIYYPREAGPSGIGRVDLERLPRIERLSCS